MKTYYRDEYRESQPATDATQTVIEYDYDSLLESPLMLELHRIASVHLGKQSFTISQLPGVSPDGKKIKFSSYSYPDMARAKFCLSVHDLSAESSSKCQANYADGITKALGSGERVSAPCRFGACMTCCISEPVLIDDQASGYWRFRSVKQDQDPVVPFADIEDEIRAENNHVDLIPLRDQYEEHPVTESEFILHFQDYLSQTVAFVIRAELESRAMAGAAERERFDDGLYDTVIQVSSGTLWDKAASMAEYKNSHLPVIIEGESGTGKEVIARSIHEASLRKGKPFVVVPCAALPLSLIEAELFGYNRGAFSGAIKDYKGFFERAHGGTLFMDEVAELPLAVQSKLLRVIEDGIFRRIGGENEVHTDLRIMISTTHNLKELADKGDFLKQLYYRINSIHIPISPVRENPEDILIYAQAFLEEYNKVNEEEKSFTSDVIKLLKRYNWPGNIRQIRIVVHQSAQLSGKKIRPSELPTEIQEYDPKATLENPADWALEAVERAHIQKAIDYCSGNISAAAKLLGINRSTIYERIKS